MEHETLTKEIAQITRIHEREVKIFEMKVRKLEQEKVDLNMPLEDYRGQVLHLQAKTLKLSQELEIEQKEGKFLRKNYVAFLIQKQWAITTKQFHDEQMRAKQEEIKKTNKILSENKSKVETLMKYKNDIERDMEIIG